MIQQVAAIGLCCLASFAVEAASAPPIAVFVDFENRPSSTSFEEMKTEVAAILAPSGVSLDWRTLEGRSDTESFSDLVVLKFKGLCQVRNPAFDTELGPSLPGQALASTMVSNGHILPFTDVKCDEIRRFLAPDLLGIDSMKQDSVYGRALGRVVAHELYHIFAGTQHHAKEGVARSAHSRRELTSKEFRFTPKETETIHELKWRALLAGEGESVSLR